VKRCLECTATFDSSGWRCPSCGHEPAQRDGFRLFARRVADDEGYDPTIYRELADLEEGNFWFVARNRLLLHLMARYVPERGRVLELGCGTGFVLQALRERWPCWQLEGSELHVAGLEFARKRVDPSITLSQMDARRIPYRAEFDVIGAFDVIEHIPDDYGVLTECHSALRPNGLLVLSVPQHMALWSPHDDLGHHCRRYEPSELRALLTETGFEPLVTTSFNALPLPLMLLSRARSRRSTSVDPMSELRIGPTVNRALAGILTVERSLTKLGVRWPVGGSRIVVARRVPAHDQPVDPAGRQGSSCLGSLK